MTKKPTWLNIFFIVLGICFLVFAMIETSTKLESARYDIVLNDGTHISASGYDSDGDYLIAHYKKISRTIHKKDIKEIIFRG